VNGIFSGQIGPAQWNLTLAAFLVEKTNSLFTAIFFACQSFELMASEGMEGMRDPKLLGLHSTNGCSLMRLSLLWDGARYKFGTIEGEKERLSGS